jgi:V8-like Glu-specific endopeptidase
MLSVVASGVQIGKFALPPSIPARRFTSDRNIIAPGANESILRGMAPDHLDFRPQPLKPPPALQVPPRRNSLLKLNRGEVRATTVFPPEDRYIFMDTAFPWSTIGRVETAGGVGSGVMIGPRHLLTVSHAMVWNSDNTAGWVKFTPSYFDGSAPFGVAWGVLVYFEVKVTPPTLDSNEQRHDYVVVVLDRRIGDTTGWMGSRTYSDSWNGGAYWRHIGYPGDLSGTGRPSYQRDIAFTGTRGPSEDRYIEHKGDVSPGQSGGPYFAWWDKEPWPRVVGVQSGEEPSINGASGGSHMVDLIIRARNDNA